MNDSTAELDNLYDLQCTFGHVYTYKTRIKYDELNVYCPHDGARLYKKAKKPAPAVEPAVVIVSA